MNQLLQKQENIDKETWRRGRDNKEGNPLKINTAQELMAQNKTSQIVLLKFQEPDSDKIFSIATK